jgi:class 3 adenylate cyclase/type II secretory pathway predicted ATPase ExeA/ketosteroid isomerase-like protein
LAPDARFCDRCGAPVETPSPSAGPSASPAAVRKTVTVLFADLGGSTGFGERTDPEVTREATASYFAMLKEIVEANGGRVAKFTGDGVLATFGIPAIAEDDAERAVRCGLDAQERFRAFADAIEARYGETLTLRVGVNTGEVVIGDGDADLVGDAVNVAARLEKECRPGSVFVGPDTWRLTHHMFGFEALGEVAVAGRAEPLAVYEVILDAPPSEVVTPFVGRDDELARLQSVFDQAVAQRKATVVTILGAAGVGKTRLARELCASVAAESDAVTFELQVDRAGGATFAPVAQLIRTATGLSEEDDPSEALERVRHLFADDRDRDRVAEAVAAVVGVAAPRSVEETFWAIRRLVETLAATRPVVVVVDDVQWAESLVLELLEHLAEWVRGAAVVLVALGRPELRELRPSLVEAGRRVSEVLALDGLDATATELLANRLLGTDRLPSGLVARLPASTDGNPLFVRELVRMLVDERVILPTPDGWELTIDADAVEVPATIQSLLAARVERLPDDERELLEFASVIGVEFSLGALRELAPADDASVNAGLERLRRKDLVEPTGTYWGDEPLFRFHHVLIRDASYRRLLKGTRAELHARAARWTDRVAADLIGEHEAVIAYHYEQAFQYRRELASELDAEATDFARRAAELLSTAAYRALARDDLVSASGLAQRALALLPADALSRAPMLLVACECVLGAGDLAVARKLVDELALIAADDERLDAWAACFEAELVGLNEPDRLTAAEEMTTGAAAALAALGDGSGEAKARQVRARLLAGLGRVGEAEAELDLSLAAARAAGDTRRVSAALAAAPLAALWGPSPVPRAGGRCLDVVRLLRITTASPSVEATSMRCQAVLEALRGRFDVARSLLASARQMLEDLGLRRELLETEAFGGVVELVAGDPVAAVAPLRSAFRGLDALGAGPDASQTAVFLARALLATGDVEEADEMAAASERLAGQNLKSAIGWRSARAAVLAALDSATEGLALAEAAVDLATGTDLVLDHIEACATLVDVRAACGDVHGARAARADAIRLCERKGATVVAARLAAADTDAARAAPDASEPTVGSSPWAPDTFATRLVARGLDLALTEPDRAIEVLAPDYERVDRRKLVGAPTVHGDDELIGSLRAMLGQGVTAIVHEVVAVRGERLALIRLAFQVGDEVGWPVEMLTVYQVNEFGLLARNVNFDVDDFEAAMDELDEGYVAGDGAAHAEQVRLWREVAAAFASHDWAAMEVLQPADMVAVNHARLNLPIDVDTMRSLAPDVPDAHLILRTVEADGGVSLVRFDVAGHVPDGGDVSWPLWSVGVSSGGRFARLEIFDVEDETAARARFAELVLGPRSSDGAPALDNMAWRTIARFVAAFDPRDFDALDALVGPEATYLDRRHGPTSPPALERDDVMAHAGAVADVGFDRLDFVPIAIRGERLVLTRGGAVAESGFALSALTLYEVDAGGRLFRSVSFEEDDLESALDELDERYLAGEGAAHAEAFRLCKNVAAAFNDRDWAAMEMLQPADMVRISHARLGPPLDVDATRSLVADVPDAYLIFRVFEADGDVSLGRTDIAGHVSDGGEVSWALWSVGVTNGGRFARLELFEIDDESAARARFTELADAQRGDHSSAPDLDNMAWRAVSQFAAMFSAREFDALAAFVSPEATYLDRRRGPTSPPALDRDDVMAHTRAVADVGFDRLDFVPIAVRGERLVLTRGGAVAESGLALPSLMLWEVDAEGSVFRTVSLDEDDLQGALDELDERYLAGEGREHAEQVRLWAKVATAFNRGDWSAMELLHPADMVGVSHQRLGSPLGVDATRSFGAEVPDAHLILRTLDADGDVSLVRSDVAGHARHGGEVSWTFWSVGVTDGERFVRLELFEIEDDAEARARFVELADEQRRAHDGGTILHNAAWRTLQRMLSAFNNGDIDSQREFVHPDVVKLDHQHLAIDPPLNGRDEYMLHLRAVVDTGMIHVEYEPVAIRGERLVLARGGSRTDSGFESIVLDVFEFDDSERLVRVVDFSDDDLAGALDELDERYIAGDGAGQADQVRRWNDHSKAFNRRDWTAADSLFGTGARVVSHMKLTHAVTDVESLGAAMRSNVGAVPDAFQITTSLEVDGEVTLARVAVVGHTPDGGEVLWVRWVILCFEDDHCSYCELFDLEDEAAARAAFSRLVEEERVARLRGPVLDNAAWRALQRVLAAFNEGDFEALRSLYHPDVHELDRRRLATSPTLVGRELYMENMRAIRDTGLTHVEFEPVAVRGERLAVVRGGARTDSGLESLATIVWEFDDEGRARHLVDFSDDDLAGALDELDERYIAGEGAADEQVVRLWKDLRLAASHHDWDAFEALCAPDMEAIDHKNLSWPLRDRTSYVDALRLLAQDVPDLVLMARTLEVDGTVTLALVETQGRTPDGGEMAWPTWSVGRGIGGRVASVEVFDIEDEQAARGRFAELAREDPRTPYPDNAAVRTMQRGAWLFSFGGDRADRRAFIADDIVHLDRRSVVRAPGGQGAETFMGGVAAAAEVFGRVALEPIAVRGDRLALFRQQILDPGGFEIAMLELSEIDDRGHICRMTDFDEADLVVALEALDARYAELSGDAYTEGDRYWAEARRLIQRRDWNGFESLLSPGLVMTDHRPFGLPVLDRSGYVAWLGSRDDIHLTQDVVAVKLYTAPGRCAAAFRIIGSSTTGVEAEWGGSVVTTFALDGRANTHHLFADDQWLEALALFDAVPRTAG